MDKAADAATIPNTSGGFSWSDDRTVRITWISLCRDFGKRGLIDLSVNLHDNMPDSPGLPSLRKKLPGILPAA